MTKQIAQVREKDYARLGRSGQRPQGSQGYQGKEEHRSNEILNEIGGKKSDQKKRHVSVLEKRQNSQDNITRERGLRVWSKKARKREDQTRKKEGIRRQIVNIGKVQRDRGVTSELLNRHELKEKKGKSTGVYTRIVLTVLIGGKNKGRENRSEWIQKNMGDQDRKRISLGRKDDTGKRKWFDKKKRNEQQRRTILNVLSISTTKEMIKTLKNQYRMIMLKGFRKQVLTRVTSVRITADKNKRQTEKK